MPLAGWRKRRPKATVFRGTSREVSAVLLTVAFSLKGLPGFDVMIVVTIFWWRSLAKFEVFALPAIPGEWSSGCCLRKVRLQYCRRSFDFAPDEKPLIERDPSAALRTTNL
tara:strand:- start:117 stop:449 length:333 start_codon:yes stop_codon:yes gene_type:complete